MFRRILVPLDGSPVAATVLPYVRALAAGPHTPVELLHAVTPDATESSVAAEHPEGPLDEADYLTQAETEPSVTAEASALHYLQRMALSFGSSGVQTFVRIGNPAEVIVEEARTTPDTLIAMTTHGRTGIGRWIMGSVADRVLQATESPLLLVRSEPSQVRGDGVAYLDKVLLPLDGSPLSLEALPVAVAIASQLNAELLLVRVVAPAVTYFPAGAESLTGLDEVFEAEEETASLQVRQAADRARSLGAAKVGSRILRGFPAAELVDLARQEPHSMTVMSTHGRSGVGRWVLGSVTDRLVRHTHEPVVVIRPRP